MPGSLGEHLGEGGDAAVPAGRPSRAAGPFVGRGAAVHLSAAVEDVTSTGHDIDGATCTKTRPAARLGAPGVDQPTRSVHRACSPRSAEDLAARLQADAEGVTKRIAVTVSGAATTGRDLLGARMIARDSLVQDRALRLRPELGPDRRGRRQRARPARPGTSWTSRSTASGLAAGAAAGRPREGRPVRPGHRGRGRPGAGRRHGDGAHHRPVARATSRRTAPTRHDRDQTPADPPRRPEGRRARRGAAVAAALPRRDRRGQVRRQRDGRRRAAPAFAEDMVFLRLAGIRPVVVHGGGPQITAMLDRLGIAGEFRAACGSPRPRPWTSSGWCCRPGRPRARRAAQRPRSVRGRHLRRGRRPVHRAAPARPSWTARRSTSGWSVTWST